MAQWDTLHFNPGDSLALSRVYYIWEPQIMGYYPGFALRGAKPPLYHITSEQRWYIGYPPIDYYNTEKENTCNFTGNFIWTRKFFGAEAKLSWRLPDSTFSEDTLVKIGVKNWNQFPDVDHVYAQMRFLTNEEWHKLKAKPQIISMDSIKSFANKNLPDGWELPYDYYSFIIYPERLKGKKKKDYRSNPTAMFTFHHYGDRQCDRYIFTVYIDYKTGKMEFSNQGYSKCPD